VFAGADERRAKVEERVLEVASIIELPIVNKKTSSLPHSLSNKTPIV
jgi:hypothetical protein